MVGDDEIAQLWSENIITSTTVCHTIIIKINSIGAEINMQIKEHVVYNISLEDVIEGVQLGKPDGEEGLNSDHIHSPRIFYVLLTLVFSHWYMGIALTLC